MVEPRTTRLEVSAGVLVTIFWLAVVLVIGVLSARGQCDGSTLAMLVALSVVQASIVTGPDRDKRKAGKLPEAA